MIKVLLIEDEPAFLQELALAVPWEDWDCMVVGTARDGLEGIEAAYRLRPDIVLTDIRMPGADGLEVVAALRERLGDAAPEFAVISGYGDFAYAREALKLGVKDYLLKPLDDDELEAAVERLKAEVGRRKGLERMERTLDEGRRSALMLFREYSLDRREDPQARYVHQAVEHIRDCYQRDLSVEDAARKLGISSGYLSRIFKKETGYTFTDYLMYYRVKRAAELLRDGERRISEVADQVGYADQRYFSQVFKRIVGITPTQFKDGT